MRYFLLSVENTIRVTSLTINEDCVEIIIHYDADVEHDKNACTRKLCRKAFNEEFHFTNIIGLNCDKLTILACAMTMTTHFLYPLRRMNVLEGAR